MTALSHLKAGAYPPDGEDFVLISIASNGWVHLTARTGTTGFRSEHFRDGDPRNALTEATIAAQSWAKELNVPVIYVEGAGLAQ